MVSRNPRLHPPDDSHAEATIGGFRGFGDARPSMRGLLCSQEGAIDAARAEDADFVAIGTHLSYGLHGMRLGLRLDRDAGPLSLATHRSHLNRHTAV